MEVHNKRAFTEAYMYWLHAVLAKKAQGSVQTLNDAYVQARDAIITLGTHEIYLSQLERLLVQARGASSLKPALEGRKESKP